MLDVLPALSVNSSTDAIEYNYDVTAGSFTTRYASGEFLQPNACVNDDIGALGPVLENQPFSTAPFQSFLYVMFILRLASSRTSSHFARLQRWGRCAKRLVVRRRAEAGYGQRRVRAPPYRRI